MTRYVVGFTFSAREVLLIRKNRPSWQAGKYNGIGGHIEPGETPDQAMTREFLEETGAKGCWFEFAVLTDKDRTWEVHFFAGGMFPDEKPRTMTDEEIAWVPMTDLPEHVLPNLRFLVPMAVAALSGGNEWPMLLVEKGA